MLKRLTVSNLAVVEKTVAEFAPGLNVITGETGAGKSVLMGALELVLGARADAGIVREGASEAEVEAVFDEGTGNREQGTGGDVVVIRRTVTAQGKSRAWINDESVSIAELKELGEGRVDIHGPRANQRILEEDFQREVLDEVRGRGKVEKVGGGGESRFSRGERGEHGEVEKVVGGRGGDDGYAVAYGKYAEVMKELEELRGGGASEDELDLLRYQLNELESAELCDDDDTLVERQAAAAHASDIVEAANEITEALGGDNGAAERIAQLHPRFAAAAKHFPSAEEWMKTAEELTIGIQELSRTVADAVSKIDADPSALAALDERLAVVNRLRRKYGDPRAKLEKVRARLTALEHREERLAELERSKAEVEAQVRSEGAKLTESRRVAAEKISKRITKELKDLGFRDAKFSVALSPIDPAPHGCDRVTFVFEPNPGEVARPLADIASSGEAARVMLAIKEVLAEHDKTELLVFDEIDANIGGEIGAVVGAKMREVARHHQVIAITHLPQSAAFGERHLVVAKGVTGGRTRTRISSVEGEDRVSEIARMLGGEDITSVVREHAKELLGLSG